ncbi:MAG: hypothetical protein JNL01_01550 [Bdellovibrionales bacterium]|nr:hypothetical protein [Bdellovibrionales bacterium]
MNASWLSLLALFLLISSQAQAGQGFRKCIPLESDRNLFLIWNESDLYAREIKYRISGHPCSNYSRVVNRRGLFKTLKPDQTDIHLSKRTLAELDQVRRGATEPLDPEMTAFQFIRKNPIYNFTVESNQVLTAKYGHGFSQDVYREWVRIQGPNAIVQDQLFSRFQQMQGMSREQRNQHLRQANPTNAVLLVALGLNWEEEPNEDSRDYVVAFFDLVRSLGIDVKILHRERYGTLEVNHDLLVPQIRDVLSQGRDVILYGLSKGAPEILSAASEVVGPYLDSNRHQTRLPMGWGRVSGAFLGSPMIGGAFVARAFGKRERPGFRNFFSFIGFDDVAGTLNVLPSMSPKSMDRWMAPVYEKLPDDVRYLTASGVIGGNGLLVDDTTGMNAFISMNRKYRFSKAANDGFIEFPGTQLPVKKFTDSPLVLIQASHMILDGYWNGVSLRDTETRHAAFTTFLSAIFRR